MEDKNPIQVAGRLFGMLELLAEHGSMSLAEMAQALGLNKSTTHRIAGSLQYMGYVCQDRETGRYEPTFRIVGLAEQIRENTDVVGLVRPYLSELAHRTGETVHLTRREDLNMVYIDKVESAANSVRMISRIGSAIPIYRSGVGKAVAAELPREEVKRIWESSEIIRMTPHTITDYNLFEETLKEVRRRGYALDNEENETGVRCIAVSLDLGRKEPEYAFSISVPIVRMNNARIKELSAEVMSVKKQIEENLG